MSTFFPLPSTYAVVEIDVQATLAGLNDPAAEIEGSGIRTTKCLVYLHTLLRLPIPDSPTFNFMAYLIGPGLRPENHAQCYVPDMCIPIHPNAAYPSGERKPLRPVGPGFPYDYCYQWNGGDMRLDIRVKNDKRSYMEAEQTSLPPLEHVRMEDLYWIDLWRSTYTAKMGHPPPASIVPRPRPVPSRLPSLEHIYIPTYAESQPSLPQPFTDSDRITDQPKVSKNDAAVDANEVTTAPDHTVDVADDTASIAGHSFYSGDNNDGSVCNSYTDYYGSSPSEGGESAAVPGCDIDIFGWDFDEKEDLLPIVNIWTDIAQFGTEDVPNPVEFVKQYNAIVRIVQESKERTKARAPPEIGAARNRQGSAATTDLPASSNASSGVCGDSPYQPRLERDSRESPPTTAECPRSIWRRLREAIRSFFRNALV